MELVGHYTLRVLFGDNNIELTPALINKFTIVSDINNLLPVFEISLIDATGVFTHLQPFDKTMSRIQVDISSRAQFDDANTYSFMVYRRHPESSYSASMNYEISGVLESGDTFAPTSSRSWDTTITEVLTQIAEEMGCKDVDINAGLNIRKKLVQPNWTNGQFLNYLKNNLVDSNGNAAHYCFVKQEGLIRKFVFQTLQSLISTAVSHKFVVADDMYEDRLPIVEYSIVDNYKMLGTFGAKNQEYNYFDYNTSKYITNTKNYNTFYSLTDYFSIDESDPDYSFSIQKLGRSNDFTSNFAGRVLSNYHSRLNNLNKLWITTWGINDIYPGNIIDVLFPQGLSTGKIFSYQYSGFWLVQRVIHNIGDTHRTELLLTRNGINTNEDCTLVKAIKKKV